MGSDSQHGQGSTASDNYVKVNFADHPDLKIAQGKTLNILFTLDFLGRAIEITIVTDDHERTIAHLAEQKVVQAPWSIYEFSPANLTDLEYRGKKSEGSWIGCFAQSGVLLWQVIEPIRNSGDSLYAEALEKLHAEGKVEDVLHLAYEFHNVPYERRRQLLDQQGWACVQEGSWEGTAPFMVYERETDKKLFKTYMFLDDWGYPEARKIDTTDNNEDDSYSVPPNIGNLASTNQRIRAGHGAAVRLTIGQTIRIFNIYGRQVIDFWAFAYPFSNPLEYLSPAQCRIALLKLTPSQGDTLVTNKRQAILTFGTNDPQGVHDWLIPPCDPTRYQHLKPTGYHRSCADNLREMLAEHGAELPPGVLPDPWNLFMNVRVLADDTSVELSIQRPVSFPGATVDLKAERDCLVVMSACPNDTAEVNGTKLKGAQFRVL